MNQRAAILVIGLVFFAASMPVRAFDSIKTTTGTKMGAIKSMTPASIVITIKQVDEEVPVNTIEAVFFDDEPNQLKTAKTNLLNDRVEDALESLKRIDANELQNARAVIKQEVQFIQAFCDAKIALAGGGDTMAAAKEMATFLAGSPGSFHYLEATELMGDLAVAVGRYADAEKYYGMLANAPWPDYKMRANVALGRAMLANDKVADAKKAFDWVVAQNTTSPLEREQQLNAQLGSARCLAASGDKQAIARAVDEVNKLLAKADPENVQLNAKAYTTLGYALRRAGEEKAALMAFLHVDVLYFADPESHAEALWNLVQLWKAVHKDERAVRAQNILNERYKNSRWAK